MKSFKNYDFYFSCRRLQAREHNGDGTSQIVEARYILPDKDQEEGS